MDKISVEDLFSSETMGEMDDAEDAGDAENLPAFGSMEEFADYLKTLPLSRLHAMHLDMYSGRLFAEVAFYLRRYPERVTSKDGNYTDLCIGPEEVEKFFLAPNATMFSNQWMNSHHIPTLDEALYRLSNSEAELKDFEKAAKMAGIELPLLRFQKNFALSELELRILMAVAIPMFIEPFMRLMTFAWADFSVRLPTVSFIAYLVSDSPEEFDQCVEAMSDRGQLVRMRLIIPEIHARYPNYTPRLYAPLSVEQRVLDAIRGIDLMGSLSANIQYHTETKPVDELIIAPETLAQCRQLMSNPRVRIHLITVPHSGARTIFSALAREGLNQNLIEADLYMEMKHLSESDLERRFSEILREALLYNAVLMLHCDSSLTDEGKILLKNMTPILSRIVRAFPGTIIYITGKADPLLNHIFEGAVEVTLPLLSASAQAQVWQQALAPYMAPELIEKTSFAFANNYKLPIGDIFRTVEDAHQNMIWNGLEHEPLQAHHLLEEVRKNFDHNLGSLADVVVSDTQFADVVLPPKVRRQIDEIIRFARYSNKVLEDWGFRKRSPYGNALSTLFWGPPGTGKTFLAGALANELGKVLYRVDLSRIVDKYVGETEKNLGRIFAEAKKAQAVLLFDEADSLFAKRTEVKSSNDRYANLEVNFLLQQLESYNGVSILTTNLEKSIDEAFKRRIRFNVEIPLPKVPERRQLWKKLLPPEAPIADDIDWQVLAECFEMSGGYIRNATLRASINAAAANTPITMQLLVIAAMKENKASGKLVCLDESMRDILNEYGIDERALNY